MKNLNTTALVFLVLAFSVAKVESVSASVLSSLVSSNSISALDEFADSSAGWFSRYNVSTSSYDRLTSGSLQVGDLIQGVIKIDAINNVDPTTKGATVFAAYSFEIVGATDNGSGGWSAMQLGAVNLSNSPGGNVLSLLNATDGRSQTFNGLADADATIAIMEKSTTANIAPTDFTALSQFDSSWTTLISAGFQNDGSSGDNLDDYVITARTIGGNQVDLKDLDALANLNTNFGSSATIADFEAAFLLQGAYGNFQYQQVLVPGANIETTADFYITNGTLKGSSSANHMFTDAGEFYGKFHSTPEPSTIAIWAALGLGGCGFVARRRIKVKKA